MLRNLAGSNVIAHKSLAVTTSVTTFVVTAMNM